ncbi:MAG: sulfatase [Puniceicoccaceae bacterium]
MNAHSIKSFHLPIILALAGIALQCTALATPNILLILSDDHSLPHVGAYGDENCLNSNITPNLDAFAKESMRFNRGYTTAAQCAPSRTSIFTGCSPIETRTSRFAQPARSSRTFFTEVLQRNGYWVGTGGRNHHLTGRGRDGPHIQEAFTEMGIGIADLMERFDLVSTCRTKGEDMAKVGENFSMVLDKIPENKPFFLYFGFNQPHRGFGNDHEGIDPDKLILPKDWPDLPEVRLDYARYLAEVRDMDYCFGKVMEVLEQRGLKENTIVIFMGDNGEALLRGKGTLYNRGINVPLMVRWPDRIKSGTTSDILVSGMDLGPTILAAAGLETPGYMAGISFLPELLGRPFESRQYIFAERGWHFGHLTDTEGFDLCRAIISDKYHYIYNAIPNNPYSPVDMRFKDAWLAIKEAPSLPSPYKRLYRDTPRPFVEIFDVDKDPFQLNNLFGKPEMEEIEREMRIALEKQMIREGDFVPLITDILGFTDYRNVLKKQSNQATE